MLQPNNDTEQAFWVVITSSACPDRQSFYAGYATENEALDMAAACNAEEHILLTQGYPNIGIPARNVAHKIPCRYTYSVIPKPAK